MSRMIEPVNNSGTNGEDDEYIDYALFTAPDFNVISFCNELVVATNTATDSSVDLTAAQQRVRFDLEEVGKLLYNESVENHSSLIAHAAKLTTVVDAQVVSATKTELEAVTQSFQRLEQQVLVPYNTALPIYTALTKLHATANMLRGFTWFAYLARQIVAMQQAAASASLAAKTDSNGTAAADASRYNVRAARTYAELTRHLTNFPKLRALKVVSEIEQVVRSSRESSSTTGLR
ncbi:Golgi transport complex subunit 5-domain-containing protein [Lipomyces oligophaga]|uniref:Golgi transport complex subunit 5-domain-containing protein n=1 Tax=Lipomyces oligophaga TaxID=45792 RepID=UPI0034CD1C7B